MSAELAERTNAQPFIIELCDILGVSRPDPARGGAGSYRFERSVTHRDSADRPTTRRIDLYKRDCFILEAKQGANTLTPPDRFAPAAKAPPRQNLRNTVGWGAHMRRARGQAERYVRDLPADEASPPFLVVCDVGFCFDLYADFSGTGLQYAEYPDRTGFRVYVDSLHRPEVREWLATIWLDPHSLNPARPRPGVAAPVAATLSDLARGRGPVGSHDVPAGWLPRHASWGARKTVQRDCLSQ